MTFPAEKALACRELVELVTEYLEGALPAVERSRFEAHLATCPGCVVYVRQFRQMLELARRVGCRLDARALSPVTRAALVAAFRDLRWAGRRPGRA